MKNIFLVLALLGACKPKTPVVSGTGIALQVIFSGKMTQLSFEAFNGATVIGPIKDEPASAGAVLKSPYATDLLFDDTQAGASVRIVVQSLSIGAVGAASVSLVKGVLTPLTITLVAPACGDGIVTDPEQCDDGNTISGDGCSATCQKETAPVATCDNGILEPGETCDIGAATSPGCVACALTAGWSCGATTCADGNCGNGVLDAGETCDDGNTAIGDGCDDSCQIEASWHCSGAPSCCQSCGNGVIDNPTLCANTTGAEMCDGALLPVGYSCLTAGFLNQDPLGTNSLGCMTDCSGFDASGCSATKIDSWAHVQTAINQAAVLPDHDIISIHGNAAPYGPPGSTAITVNEVVAVGGSGGPAGVTLAPVVVGGVAQSVTFTTDTATSVSNIFDVKSGNNNFVDLNFQIGKQGGTAITFDGPATNDRNGHNVVEFCTFERSGAGATGSPEFININSNGNTIAASTFENTNAAGTLTAAIQVSSGASNTIGLSVIANDANSVETYGIVVSGVPAPTDTLLEANYFSSLSDEAANIMTSAILLNGVNGSTVAANIVTGSYLTAAVDLENTGTTNVDNNTIAVGNSPTLIFDNAGSTCYRNNIVVSSGAMTISGAGTSFPVGVTACDGFPSSKNVYSGTVAPCAGTGCASECVTAGDSGYPLCDLSASPAFDTAVPAAFCLPAGSAYADEGQTITCGGTTPCYDFVDDKPNVLYYNGTAPPLGARDSNEKRVYGVDGMVNGTNTVATCP